MFKLAPLGWIGSRQSGGAAMAIENCQNDSEALAKLGREYGALKCGKRGWSSLSPRDQFEKSQKLARWVTYLGRDLTETEQARRHVALGKMQQSLPRISQTFGIEQMRESLNVGRLKEAIWRADESNVPAGSGEEAAMIRAHAYTSLAQRAWTASYRAHCVHQAFAAMGTIAPDSRHANATVKIREELLKTMPKLCPSSALIDALENVTAAHPTTKTVNPLMEALSERDLGSANAHALARMLPNVLQEGPNRDAEFCRALARLYDRVSREVRLDWPGAAAHAYAAHWCGDLNRALELYDAATSAATTRFERGWAARGKATVWHGFAKQYYHSMAKYQRTALDLYDEASACGVEDAENRENAASLKQHSYTTQVQKPRWNGNTTIMVSETVWCYEVLGERPKLYLPPIRNR